VHIRDEDELISDEEGAELPDLDAAKSNAIAGAPLAASVQVANSFEAQYGDVGGISLTCFGAATA